MQRSIKMWPVIKKEYQPIEKNPKMALMLELAEKDFRTIVRGMFKDMKERPL